MEEQPIKSPESEHEPLNGKNSKEKQISEKRGSLQEERKKAQKKASEKNAKSAQGKKIEKLKKTKLDFSDARVVSEMVRAVQDEDKVEMTPQKIEVIRDILGKSAAYSKDELEEMDIGKLVTEGQDLIRHGQIEEPKDGDFADLPEDNFEIEKELLAKVIDKAQDPSEETLTPEKVREYVKITETAEQEKNKGKKNSQATQESNGTDETKSLEASLERENGVDIKIVDSKPHLQNIDDRKEVREMLESANVNLVVPDRWGIWTSWQRVNWLKNNRIFNMTKLPDAVTGEKILYEEDGGKVRVIDTVDGRLQLIGMESAGKDDILDLIKKAGVEDKVEFPDLWDEMSISEKKAEMREKRIELVLAIEGGGSRWTDNAEVDLDIAVNRLTELEEEENRIGKNDFVRAGYDNDRSELTERMIELSLHPKIKFGWVLNRLVHYEVTGTGGSEKAALQKFFESVKQKSVDSATRNRNYRLLDLLNRASKDQVARVKGNAEMTAALDNIFSPNQRENLEQMRLSVYNHFNKRLEEIKHNEPERYKALFEQLDTRLQTLRDSLRYTSGGLEDVEGYIIGTVRDISSEMTTEDAAFVEWKAVKDFENVSKQYITEKDLGVPLDWRDSMRNTLNNLRIMESTDFQSTELQQVLNNINTILLAMPPTQSIEVSERQAAEDLRAEINDLKNSVQAVYVLRNNMFGTAMNPEEIQKLFQNEIWTDETWRNYFKRFFKDHLGREFIYTDAHGNEKKFNLQDKAMQAYFKRFTYERRRMNEVEEMTRRDLDASSTNMVEQWLIQRMNSKGYDLADWGRNMAHTRAVIDDWYRENLLLGAHGFDSDGNDLLDLRKKELVEDLKDSMRSLGIDDKRLEEYAEAGLFNQVINNAYYLTWSWGGFSDYDVIRIWDRGKIWHDGVKKTERLGAISFNQHSDHFGGRLMDHYTEFLLDEKRGRSGRHGRVLDSNYIFQKHMLGKRRGILHHNRLLVKMINDCISAEDDFKDKLVVAGGGNWDSTLDATRSSLENVDKLNLSDDDDKAWATGVAIAELLEDGDISLENIEWSEAFNKEMGNLSKFNMADFWGDRATTWKYFGAEAFQTYLQTPNAQVFWQLNSINNFYSRRENRIKSWMKLALPAHFELGEYWRKWWKMEYNMPHAEREEMIDYAVASNRLDSEDHHDMKLRYTGWGPFQGGLVVRNAREWAEVIGLFAWERGIKTGWWGMPSSAFAEFIKQLFRYTTAGFAQ